MNVPLIWPDILALMEREQTGPEDPFDEAANGDPDSMNGEDDEEGFDEMSSELGWDDELDDEELDDEEDGE